ncbi:hypothetical protein B0H12DRAFT_1246941 [Mycena haematopus]|nr:hypothetical protein B0H12DRAFT_1246941 [Mycena haematopus]
MQDLAADLNDWEVECEERAEMLAEKHSMKVKEVRRRMLSTSTFKPKRKVSVYNAKISRIMADLNTGRGLGDCYKIPDIKRMVRDDPSMLDGFTEEEEKEMVDEMDARRKVKFRGTRANNKAAGVDAKKTVMRLSAEITALAERCGMIGFAMFTRGHVHDTAVPLTVQSWGALDFFRETLKKDPADVAALFELWAVSRERGDIGGDSLREMQQECTSIIKTGLQAALGRTKVAMNYDNYVKSLVEGKNVGLVGWPEGVDFKCMSLQSAVGPLRILRDALKCGTCRWKILTAGEKKRLLEQFDEMVKNGEAQQKTKKPRVKKAASSGSGRMRGTGGQEDDEGSDDPQKDDEGSDDPPPRKTTDARARKTAESRPKDKGTDSRPARPPNPGRPSRTCLGRKSARGFSPWTPKTKATKRKKNEREDGKGDTRRVSKRKPTKRKTADQGDSDNEPPQTKKVTKRKRDAGGDDERARRKKKSKHTAGDGDRANPAPGKPAQEWPKPRPLNAPRRAPAPPTPTVVPATPTADDPADTLHTMSPLGSPGLTNAPPAGLVANATPATTPTPVSVSSANTTAASTPMPVSATATVTSTPIPVSTANTTAATSPAPTDINARAVSGKKNTIKGGRKGGLPPGTKDW